ncbi:response regulator [Paenibacillus roseipurpureus]|uniref:Response regulator n=1 Tax=Paenibacillus roseopurpureus TaxID=2918901 RepID=A0AA96RHE9_9BACL|nr:response regulator [Paenibacillus sp. MBLB1832]WNR43263.1 response regulator [Paenibacillus sp. MBLB1832]
MRILIVDDEILVRIGLKTIIPRGNEAFQVIGEAANGVEALHILENQACDVVLTDIRMPEMDGLELLKQIRERWPAIKCLILSNHHDFNYVQQALRLGAIEYVTKLEINPSELKEKLEAIQEQLDIEKQGQNARTQLEQKVNQYSKEVKEKRLREMLLGHVSRGEIEQVWREFQLEPFLPPLSAAVIQIEDYEALMQHNRFQSDRLLTYTVQNVLNEILKKYGNGELIEVAAGKFCVLTGQLNVNMLQEMQNAAQAFLKISLAIGVSPPWEDPLSLHPAFEKADHALSYRFYYGGGCIIHYEQLSLTPPTLSEPWEEEEWSKYIEEGNETGLLERVLAWADAHSAQKTIPPAMLREQWLSLLHMFARCLKADGGDIYSVTLHEQQYPYHVIRNAETLQDISQWFRGWLPVYFAYKRQHGKEKLRPEIQAVIRQIMAEYNLPLKVADLASTVGYTENYLSILFKKETGKTITDYMTNVRMKNARELLKNPDYKIFEISELIGYADPNHFSRIFKQMEGMYPTEFRKLIFGQRTS